MILFAAAACVFVAVWVASLPTPATLRLTTVFAGPPPGSPTDHLDRVPRAITASARAVAAISWSRKAAGAVTRRRRRLAARRAAVIELCDAIAVELAAGRPAGTALARAADGLPGIPGLGSVIDAARSGDDVADALIRASRAEGCEALRLLAGCWRIGVDRGGMLAAVIEGLAEALRDEQSHREDIALQLAGPRATARLLALLPALGLAMAAALGAKPLRFLFGTLPGALCLGIGLALDALGLWWTSRLAATAEQGR
jgi:tight adherence protein B